MHPLVLNSFVIPIVLVHNLDQGFYFIVVAGCDVWEGGCPCYWVLLWQVLIYHPIQPAYLHFDASFSFFCAERIRTKCPWHAMCSRANLRNYFHMDLKNPLNRRLLQCPLCPQKQKEGIAMNNYFNEWIQAKLNIYKSPLESQVVFFVLVTNIPFLVYTVSVLAFLFFRGYSQVCCHLMNAIWRLKENTKCH